MRSENHRFPNTDTMCLNVNSRFRVATIGDKRGKTVKKKKTEEAITGSRAVKVGAVRYTMAELLAGAEASRAYSPPPEEREWVDAPSVGREWPNDEK